MRGFVNGNLGENILTSNPATNDTLVKGYTTVLDAGWIEKNISIVVFIYNTVTKEVINVSEEHLHL